MMLLRVLLGVLAAHEPSPVVPGQLLDLPFGRLFPVCCRVLRLLWSPWLRVDGPQTADTKRAARACSDSMIAGS